MSNLFRTIVVLALLCTSSATATADVFYDTYQRGLAAFKAADYASARADFLRAYDLRPKPNILFSIAQTYRFELNPEQALIYYKRFLAESKITEDLRKEAESYVTTLEAELVARDAEKNRHLAIGRAKPDETSAVATTQPLDGRPQTSSTAPPGTAEAAHADAPATGSPGDVWSTKRKIAVASASGGVLALAVGAILGFSAKSRERDAHALCTDPQRTCDAAARANDLLRSGHRLAIDADVAFGIGAIATIAAGALWFTGRPESHRRVAVIPTASSAHVLITAGGSF